MDNARTRFLQSTKFGMNGLGLMLWGWQCDFIIYAILMAILVELPSFTSWRINIKDNEFNHISDLSSIMFFLVIVYVFMTRSYPGIFTLLSLFPFLLFLIFLSQKYSTEGVIKQSALFISMRRLESDDFQNVDTGIDLSYPYLLLCMISASAGNKQPLLFYLLIVILILWSLWSLRPRHTRTIIWLILFITTGTAGYTGQIGIQKMQSIAESTFLLWFDQFMWRSRDPKRTNTAIGSLGKLKLSDRIMVRINTHNKKLTGPLLLREATYLSYGYGIWTNFQNTFQVVDPAPGGKQWLLNPAVPGSDILTISFHLDDQIAIIPAPHGVTSISNVVASEIEYSPYGAISMEFNPGWIKYDVTANRKIITDTIPDKDDFDLPAIYKKDLDSLVLSLELNTMSAEERLHTIKKFFAENFTYSLTQRERYPRGKYLTKFLFETRKGHCEYFATATALLLRAAGIASRYIVGYSVQEYSQLENQYIARARDAHSWVLAYVNNNWHIVDTTPPVWAALESEEASFIEPLVDFWSWLSYKVSSWETDNSESGKTRVLVWLLLPILIFYLWKMFIKPRINEFSKNKIDAGMMDKYHLFLPHFSKLLQVLEIKYGGKNDGETLLMWITRLEKYNRKLGFDKLLKLYYRYRFDPEGLHAEEETELNHETDILLEKMNR